MKQLKELTKIVTRKKLMRLSIIGQSTDSKLDQLYELIVDQKVSSDDEAAQILYQKTASFSPYQKVKSKLKARLAEMTLLIDVNQPINGDANLAYREAWHLWSIANQLMSRSAKAAFEEYAKKALKLALDYEHIDLVIKISKVLRRNSATYLGDENLFDHYDEMYHNHLQASLAEAKVEECYEKIMILLVREKSNSKAIAELGEQFYVELKPLLNKFDQLSIHRFIRYIQVTYLLHSFAYQETIDACQEAIIFFQMKKLNLQNTIISFMANQLVCYIQLKDFKNGQKKYTESLETLGNDNDQSLFKLKELGLILFLHNQYYQKAYELCFEVLSSTNLNNQSKFVTETWRIYGAYIHYFIYIGKVIPLEGDRIFTTFRLGKFLNEVPAFSKDKRGMNIPILIIQFLFTIVMGKYDQAFDQIEAIERYVSRYIKKDEHYRSNCFIKMLLIIPKQGFHKLAVIRHTEKLRKKLSEVPLEIANQPHEVEMIPYEDLWQMALDTLGLKHIKLKRRKSNRTEPLLPNATFIPESNRIMEQLKELTKIVTRKKLMRLSIIGQSTDSKLDKLYLLIVDQKVSSDDEAAQILYQKTASFSPYQKVKSKLKARLAEMILLIDADQPVNGDANLAHREAWRLWSIANQLISRNSSLVAVEYAQKALKLALDYEHIDLVVEISRFLRKNAATYLGGQNLFDHYNEMHKNYLPASLAEAKVEECYEKVMILGLKEKFNNKAIVELGEQFYVELKPLLNKFDQLSIHRFIRLIQVMYLFDSFAYQETIEASQEALDFFETKKINLQHTIVGFLVYQLICYTQLKEFELGYEKFNRCIEILEEEKNITFFKVNELGLILFLHNTKYQEAYKLCLDTLNTKSLRQEVGYCQEAWRINGAYIHYLIYIGKVTPLEDDKTFTTFRLGKFLNEVPVFSKDKRGMNIPILIIQFLFTIVMGKYDQAFDRIEAIERYVSRYIKKDEHYRSNCFIKMLLIIPKQGFHKLAVIRHTEKLRKKLSEVPLEIANQIYEVEMIPYEDLWQMALDSLGLKHIKLR